MKLSVIIPAINEAASIAGAVESAWAAGATEVIVVDGGSRDDTKKIALEASCVWVDSEPGRGTQLCAGAELATGDTFLFLHADARLAPSCGPEIENALSEGCVGGCFAQRIDASGIAYRAIEWGNGVRARFQNLMYGDQGIFVAADAYRQSGGFQAIPLMEDFVFSQTLKKLGRLKVCPGPITIQARRWKKVGPIRQTLRNWSIALRFRLGASPESLAKLYRRHDS